MVRQSAASREEFTDSEEGSEKAKKPNLSALSA